MRVNKIVVISTLSLICVTLTSCAGIFIGNSNSLDDLSDLKPAENYFEKNVAVDYLVENHWADRDNHFYTFDDLAKKEISSLTQDLIYRLFSVYGAGCATTEPNGTGYNLLSPDGTEIMYLGSEISYLGRKVPINNDSLVLTPFEHLDSEDPVYLYSTNVYYSSGTLNYSSPLLDELGTYAYNYSTGHWSNSTIQGACFDFENSINGGYTYTDKFDKTAFSRLKHSWNYNYENTEISPSTSIGEGFSSYYLKYKDIFETGIANALAGTKGLNLNDAVGKINEMFFSTENAAAIISYIKNDVIDSDLIAQDDAMLNRLNSVLGGYELNQENVQLLTNDNQDLHYYKAYSLLIPAIVNQAFNVTFEKTQIKLHYSFSRTRALSSVWQIDNFFAVIYTKITLTTKIDQLKLTRMAISISNINIDDLKLSFDIEGIAKDVSVELIDCSKIVLDFRPYNSTPLSKGKTITLKFNYIVYQEFKVRFLGYCDEQ